jgi:prepilin-type N-terminal cleavage/methylation domain-containing protein
MHLTAAPGSRASISPDRSQFGLTLIELIVVLALLAAVAGLVSASMPNLTRRAAHAAGAAGAQQITRAMMSFRTSKGFYPDGYDSLTEYKYVVLKALPKGSYRQLKPKDLDNADRPFLRRAGIKTTWRHDTNGPVGVTFRAVTAVKAFDALAGGTIADDVAALDPHKIDVDALFGPGTQKGTSNEIFAVFGIGRHCSLVGPDALILEAPITFGGTTETNPDLVYQRYGVVFRLDRDDVKPLRFLGAVVFDEDGIKTTSDQLAEFFH